MSARVQPLLTFCPASSFCLAPPASACPASEDCWVSSPELARPTAGPRGGEPGAGEGVCVRGPALPGGRGRARPSAVPPAGGPCARVTGSASVCARVCVSVCV